MKILFSHSRTSLFYSLKLLELKKGDKILIPDYNCESFMLAIKDLSIEYKTYPTNLNLSINISKLEKKITKKVKAILAVNYFGITKDLLLISDICKKRKIFLINDNAHGATGKIKKKNIIEYGDLGFESYHKMFNSIESLSVLSINNKMIKKKLNNLKLPTVRIKKNYQKWYFMFKNKIKFILFKKLRIEKHINENDNDNRMHKFLPSNYDIEAYKNINFQRESLSRKKIIKSVKKFMHKFKLKPLRANLDSSPMMWYYPVMINDTTKKKFTECLKSKNIPFIRWPKLPAELKTNKNILIKNRIICLPLDSNYYEHI